MAIYLTITIIILRLLRHNCTSCLLIHCKLIKSRDVEKIYRGVWIASTSCLCTTTLLHPRTSFTLHSSEKYRGFALSTICPSERRGGIEFFLLSDNLMCYRIKYRSELFKTTWIQLEIMSIYEVNATQKTKSIRSCLLVQLQQQKKASAIILRMKLMCTMELERYAAWFDSVYCGSGSFYYFR